MNSVPSGSAFLGLQSGFNHHFKEVYNSSNHCQRAISSMCSHINNIWLVVPTPLSVGVTIPSIWKNKSHVPVTTNQILLISLYPMQVRPVDG